MTAYATTLQPPVSNLKPIHSNRLYELALSLAPGIGPITAKQLVSYCGSAKDVFKATQKEILSIPNVGPGGYAALHRPDLLKEASNVWEQIQAEDLNVLSFFEANYPQRLRQYPDSPILLYYQGEADLNTSRIISIVGTRAASRAGKQLCEQLITDLQAYQPMIISGLAYGIDITAHRQSLKQQLPTIGLVAHGLSHIYPSVHRNIAKQMVEQGGGILSEYLPHVKPEKEHFPMRNRLVAGMSDATIVIETPKKGGSMITAQLANTYHKDVFAFPGRPGDLNSAGCNHLIKTHQATLIDSAKDLAKAMNWDAIAPGTPAQSLPPLSEQEQELLYYVPKGETVHIDIIVQQSAMSHSLVNNLLLDLEFKGFINSLPGKRYILN